MMTNCKRKEIIVELQKIKKELEMVDFLRKYFHEEYSVFFEKEKKEKENMEKSNINLGVDYIRKYTWCMLERDLPKKLNIGRGYMGLDELKVIILFENRILVPLDSKDENYIRVNEKIKEIRKVYTFFRALIAKGICKLQKYPDAIQTLDYWDIPQSFFDEDEYHVRHDTFAKTVLDNYLWPFIDEYKNYL